MSDDAELERTIVAAEAELEALKARLTILEEGDSAPPSPRARVPWVFRVRSRPPRPAISGPDTC